MGEVTALDCSKQTLGPSPVELELARWRTIGVAILCSTVIAGLVFAVFVPMASAVHAFGHLKVDSNRKRIQPAEPGVVREILVRDGSRVRAGDVLVMLDDTQAGATHEFTATSRDQARAAIARLLAERDGRGTILFPRDLAERAAHDAQVSMALQVQRQLFDSRRANREGELQILDRQVQALKAEIGGLTAQRASKESQIASAKADWRSLLDLDKVGMVEKTRLRSAERIVAEYQGELEELVTRIASATAGISEREARKAQVVKAFAEEVAAELRSVRAAEIEFTGRASAARRSLDMTEIRSPVDGVVTELRVLGIGSVVASAEVLMEVVPLGDRLLVEARVPPFEIDRVQIGLPAAIRLQAFNARIAPELRGKVTHVSADAIADPRTDTPYYLIRITLDQADLARLNERDRLLPGMQAEVFVRTGERTFWTYLTQPLRESFQRAWLER